MSVVIIIAHHFLWIFTPLRRVPYCSSVLYNTILRTLLAWMDPGKFEKPGGRTDPFHSIFFVAVS